ncbi:MAG TPA: hypothetical protein VFC68_07850, partial [Treponemataceae bacterium]|nr:hypothetical protein [Treponemataceae bacterium]
MKKMAKMLFGLIAIFAIIGLSGCPGTTDTGGGSGGGDSTIPTWKIKGSFDGWTEHDFTMDEVEETKGAFTYSDLYAIDYEFVIMYGDNEFKVGTEPFAIDTATTFDDPKGSNAKFTAEKKAYEIKLDITDPAAPIITVTAATEDDANLVTNDVLADKLLIKGDQFTIGWDPATAGIYDDNTDTVTFAGLIASNKNGGFGFESLEGFLNFGAVAGPETESATPKVVTDFLSGGNCTINNVPKKGTEYTIAVTLDASKTVATGRYVVTITLTTMGTEEWAFDVPASIWVVGN